MSFKQLNRRIFDLAPARWAGTHIYDWRRRHQPPTQSTTTKFFRNLQQLAALEGPLSSLTQAASLSVLVAGCSYGCEAYSLGGFLSLRFPRLNWRIDAVDISPEARGSPRRRATRPNTASATPTTMWRSKSRRGCSIDRVTHGRWCGTFVSASALPLVTSCRQIFGGSGTTIWCSDKIS